MTSAALRIARRELGSAIAAAWNFLGGRLPDGLTFSRASGATVFAPARYDTLASWDGSTTTGWTASGDTAIAATGGVLRVTRNTQNYVYASAATVPGAVYRFSWKATAGTTGVYVFVGTAIGNAALVGADGTSGNRSAVFVATGATTFFHLGTNGGAAGTYADYDDILIERLTIWQPGMDWLGPELVTNGTLASGLSGWAAANASMAVVAGTLEITGTGSLYPLAYSEFQAAAGRTYQVSLSFWKGTANADARFVVQTQASVNQTTPLSNATTTPATQQTTLTAAASQTLRATCYIDAPSSGTGTAYFDNISVREQLYTWQQVLVPAGVPRFLYDSATFSPLGLLIEPQRTNLVSYSTNFAANWGGTAGMSRSLAGGLSPYGTPWTRCVEDGSAGAAHCIYGGSFTLSLGMGAASFLIKAGTRRYVAARAESTAGSTYAWVCVDTQAGTIAANASVTSSSIKAFGGGVFLVSLTWANSNPGVGNVVFAASNVSTAPPTNNVLGPTFTGDGVSDFYVDGVQVEAGTEATSYIPTAGAAATRAADDPRDPTGINLTQGTLVYEAISMTLGGSSPIEVGGPPGVFALYLNQNKMQDGNHYTGVGATGTGGPVRPIRSVALSWNGSSFSVCANGGAGIGNTSGPVAGGPVPSLRFGAYTDGTQPSAMCLRSVRKYTRAMSAAELQALTR